MPDVADSRATTRAAIIDAAARLLSEGGPGMMTTRRVADAAGVQAPTIYRLFGDKDGLLEAVAEHVMAVFVAAKADTMTAATAADTDPLDDLRESWQRQIDFGLANPAVFRLLSDPDRVRNSPAAQAGRQVLATRVRRLAMTGYLRLPEATAVALIHAAGVGTIQSLLATPADERDPTLAATMLDAVLRSIVSNPPPTATKGPAGAAISLRAVASQLDALSVSEQQLLAEWLERIATHATPTQTTP